ncbi:MAG TPA: V-type ATP synthase subunit B [Gemmatimonadaceae bacterium]|nr:V-type ATP synthase subunit B [Gemmatimonadaceae bacterium]
MTRIAMERTYRGAAAAGGPLLFLEGTRGVALNEWVVVRMDGQADRRGQVIEAGERTTVVQLLDETIGLQPHAARVILTGDVARTVVGRELLGRAFDGHGAPIDGLPVPVGEALRPITGAPINPVRRAPPSEFIETGVSAIDAMNTLVRGQKLPVFSGPGLPGLEIAARIVEWSRAPRGEPFAVVFAAIGITARETDEFARRVREGGAMPRTVLFLNQASHPAVERLLAPRLALTVAEHLAFDCGLHVLVVLADMTHYCEALREIATAREEIPGRRGYPGYMYTDLASIYERAGIVRGAPGSITQIPILTMPDDDVTHPIPDLTGYITEGQIVLDRDLHRRGIAPPIDILPSLSRLMGGRIGAGRTRPEHREWSDQLYATYARGREARTMAAIVSESGLPPADRRAMAFAEAFEREFIAQPGGRRTLDETFEVGWRLLDTLPRDDLFRISDATWDLRRGRGAS